MEKDLNRNDWLRVARMALLKRGVDAVRVAKLARNLHVTRGSFYWHFTNRADLLEALLREWEEEKNLLFDLLGQKDKHQGLTDFFRELDRRVRISERGEWPSDAAIFAWAAVSSSVAKRANKEEKIRIRLLKKLFGEDEVAEYVYMAYLGFLLRRRRVPEAAKNFRIWTKTTRTLLLNSPRFGRSKTETVRAGTRP
jgi:AcrR family transcriptional regulator